MRRRVVGERMTDAERAVVLALAEAWNLFLKLPFDHPDDNDEFRRLIHAAQEKVMSRTGRREMNACLPWEQS